MNFFDRFSGRVPPDFVNGAPASNAAIADPPSLQLLFAEAVRIPAGHLAAALRAYHPDLANASVELMPMTDVPGSEELLSRDGPPAALLGLIGWGAHVVKLVSFDAAMPSTAIEACLQAALLPPEVKADARAHQSHMLLYYGGYDDRPLEQLIALAAVAGVLAEFGAIVTLNEEARAAILSTDLLPDQDGEDMLAVLRSLPIPYLFGGFVKLVLSDTQAIWWRTFANQRLGLPNLACFAASHDEGQATFRLFSGLLGYLQEMNLQLDDGEVLRIDEETLFKLRKPAELEWWLDSVGPMWVMERES